MVRDGIDFVLLVICTVWRDVRGGVVARGVVRREGVDVEALVVDAKLLVVAIEVRLVTNVGRDFCLVVLRGVCVSFVDRVGTGRGLPRVGVCCVERDGPLGVARVCLVGGVLGVIKVRVGALGVGCRVGALPGCWVRVGGLELELGRVINVGLGLRFVVLDGSVAVTSGVGFVVA